MRHKSHYMYTNTYQMTTCFKPQFEMYSFMIYIWTIDICSDANCESNASSHVGGPQFL